MEASARSANLICFIAFYFFFFQKVGWGLATPAPPPALCIKSVRERCYMSIFGEHLNRESNKAQGVRLDIHTRGLWELHRSAFFHVRVCHPNVVPYRDLGTQQNYRIHEKEKKRLYSKRVQDIEHGAFTPLVFTTTGGMGKECLMYHSRNSTVDCRQKMEAVCQDHLMDQNQNLIRTLEICVSLS